MEKSGCVLCSWDFAQNERPISQALDEIMDVVIGHVDGNAVVSTVVCPGPGSFTGIRIGISAAQAFCRATRGDLYALSLPETLRLRAFSNSPADTWIALDGRNGYFAVASLSSSEFTFVPYSECAGFDWGLEKKNIKVIGYASEIEKLKKISACEMATSPLDAIQVATQMAEIVLSFDRNERSSRRYQQPLYGLEAFTTKHLRN